MTYPVVYNAQALVRMFDHALENCYEQKIYDDEDCYVKDSWSAIDFYQAMDEATAHYFDMMSNELVKHDLLYVEKPFREGRYIRVHAYPTELGEHVWNLARIGIDWNIRKQKPVFKSSANNLLREIAHAENWALSKSVVTIRGRLDDWLRIFPKKNKEIEEILEAVEHIKSACKAVKVGIRWNSINHCADKEETLRELRNIFHREFSDSELAATKKIIAAAHTYWPNDPEVEFMDDEMTLILLGRYYRDGVYSRV